MSGQFDVEQLLTSIVYLQGSYQQGCGKRLYITVDHDSMFSGARSLDSVERGHVRGITIEELSFSTGAVMKVAGDSLAEIRSLKSKVKVLEQKLQAISDVLKGDV